MSSSLLKGAHISERKIRELVNLFSEDLTAIQISNITMLSRITINQYLKKIRQQIATNCNARLPPPYNEVIDWPLTYRFGIIQPGQDFLTIPFDESQSLSGLPEFLAIADFKHLKLQRLDVSPHSNGRPVMDELTGFWGLSKNRLQKFRGLQLTSVLLHVKECEFRYNNRHNNLKECLVELLLKN
jgi:transposase